jgi:hypothetical protein
MKLPHNRAGYGAVNLRTIRPTIQPVLVPACAGTQGGHLAFTDHCKFKSFEYKPSTYRGAGSGALGYFFGHIYLFHLQELGKVSNVLAEVQCQSTQALRSSIIPIWILMALYEQPRVPSAPRYGYRQRLSRSFKIVYIKRVHGRTKCGQDL